MSPDAWWHHVIPRVEVSNVLEGVAFRKLQVWIVSVLLVALLGLIEIEGARVLIRGTERGTRK